MEPINVLDLVQPEDGDDIGPALARAIAAAKTAFIPPGEHTIGPRTLELLSGAIVGAPADPEAFG